MVAIRALRVGPLMRKIRRLETEIMIRLKVLETEIIIRLRYLKLDCEGTEARRSLKQIDVKFATYALN